MTTMSKNDAWTDKRVEKLKTLWASGLSCSQIAAELGGFEGCGDYGRSAVIGKIHRMKLPDPVGKKMPRRGEDRMNWPRPLPRGSDSKPVNRDFRASLADAPYAGVSAPRRRPEPLPRRNPSHNILAAIAIAGSEPGLSEKLKGEKPTGAGVKLIDLDETTCRYPKGDPLDENFEFCGGYALKDRPYCSQHCRLAFLPVQSRKRAGSVFANV